MDDASNLFTEEGKLIGYVDTQTGGLLIADGIWEDQLPRVDEKRISLDFALPESGSIPVYGALVGGKRVLLINIDDIEPFAHTDEVETEDEVDLPEPEKEEGEEEQE